LKQISFFDDIRRIGEIPCARNSLLAGIASGVGVGVLRGINARLFVASNWAAATFTIVTLGTWNVCQNSIRREREQARIIVEGLAARSLKLKNTASEGAQAGNGSPSTSRDTSKGSKDDKS